MSVVTIKPTNILGETLTVTAHPGQVTIVTICGSYFMTEGPGKECGANKAPPT